MQAAFLDDSHCQMQCFTISFSLQLILKGKILAPSTESSLDDPNFVLQALANK